MANVKISELTELAVPASLDDELPINDVDAGPLETKRAQLRNILAIPAGAISVQGGAAAQVPGTTFVKLTAFTTDGESTGGVTPDAANDEIILDEPGLYFVRSTISFSGTANATFTFRCALDGTTQPETEFIRKIGSGGDIGNSGRGTLIRATAGQALSLHGQSGAGGESLTIVSGGLTAIWVGP